LLPTYPQTVLEGGWWNEGDVLKVALLTPIVLNSPDSGDDEILLHSAL
jgi:hypothetical protein